MEKICKLVCVTSYNNNKYYDMHLVGDTIQVKYGRVGLTECKASYPSHKWNSLRVSKIKKGYKDITDLCVKEKVKDFASISDNVIQEIVNKLQAYANSTISTNYMVSSDAVTEKQIEAAQEIINDLLSIKNKPDAFNKSLLELYTTIPRKMSNVKDYLIDGKNNNYDYFIDKEQSLLDVMIGQVKVASIQKESSNTDKNILDALGINIFTCDDNEISIIKDNLGEINSKFSRAWRIENKITQERFNAFLSSRENKTTKLLWHGSRNENWWNIINTGLVLRPTNSVITGKMYGYGTYFADKARKSLGYTSIRGSYWSRGTSDEAFMSLYEVHLGNMLTRKRHENWMYRLDEKSLRSQGDYDSFFAQGGVDLINNEYIVYREDQTTIKYLVEIK